MNAPLTPAERRLYRLYLPAFWLTAGVLIAYMEGTL